MSRKLVTTTKITCDICNTAEAYEWSQCLGCGRDLCYDCRVTYQHAVSFSGSNDGYYCQACDLKFQAGGGDHLWAAYRRIQHIRAERKAFYERSETEGAAVEQTIRELRAKRGIRS